MKEQKLYGIILLALVAFVWFVTGNTSLLLGLLGVYLLFTRRCLIYKGGEHHGRKQ